MDGIKTSNHYSNLEWVTNQENMVHAVETGLIKVGSLNPTSIFTGEEIKHIRHLRHVKKYKFKEIMNLYKKATAKETFHDICLYRTYKDIQ